MEDEPTVIRKNRQGSSKDARSAAAVNRAMATGDIEVTRKVTAATNRAASSAGATSAAHLAKIENETEAFRVATVDRSVSRAICDARQRAGMTQKQLATAINEKPQVLQELESGKAVPNHSVLGKLERALKVHLRGAKIGQPM